MIWLEKEFDFKAGAILNFAKPEGKSSFWVVKKVRRIIQTKVGHAGTLDPFASGVLLLCTGKATKQVASLMDMPKIYVGEIALGVTTNTDDVTGECVEKKNVPDLNIQEIKDVCNKFVGEINQIPPMFSAKKVQGRRLYKIARTGKVIERKPNLVFIENIEVLSYEKPNIKIKVKCSKGTYIRALARDIGEHIGCGGHLKSLIRTQIGEFKIEDSLNLEQFQNKIIDTQPSG
ncbi:tRNA pseudouridine(55) synthase TruB [candidate division KSB1 bacterium]|nr:tRNA pseudouridine(55) synthase TruB [candidate division KSB1 bacterium]